MQVNAKNHACKIFDDQKRINGNVCVNYERKCLIKFNFASYFRSDWVFRCLWNFRKIDPKELEIKIRMQNLHGACNLIFHLYFDNYFTFCNFRLKFHRHLKLITCKINNGMDEREKSYIFFESKYKTKYSCTLTLRRVQ